MPEKFTVEKLLLLDSMKGSVIVAGQKGSGHLVSSATVIDMPDLGHWANQNDAVIVTDYPFRNNQEALMQAVQSLIQRDAAVLCIKTSKNYELPASFLQLCDQTGFTVIHLPLSAIFSNIVYEITYTLLHRKIDYFRQLQMTTEALIETLQQPGDLTSKLSRMEQSLHHKILFVHKGRQLYFSEETRSYLDQYGEDVYPLLRLTIYQEMEKQFSRGQAVQNVTETGPEEASQNTVSLEIPWREEEIRISLLQIHVLEGDLFTLAVIEDKPLEWYKLSALERVSRILILEYKNIIEIRRLQKKHEDKFITNLLCGNYKNNTDIAFSARAYDLYLPADKTYWVIVVNCYHNSDQCKNQTLSLEFLGRDHNHVAGQWFYTVYTGKLTILLYHDQGLLPPEPLIQSLSHQLRQALNTDQFCLCISDPGHIGDIPELYRQALYVEEISNICEIHKMLIQEQDLGVLPLLYPLKDNLEVKKYIGKILNSLIRHDKIQKSQLCQTLYAYLTNNTSTKETAEALFTHYNTITYRLERIEEILGTSIRSGETQFKLRLAFELKRLMNEAPEFPGE